MSFLDDPDYLRAVAEEWETPERTILALSALVDAAMADGAENDEVVRWITDRGYGEVDWLDGEWKMRITVAGFHRALG